jgi:hypothetical protein
MSKTLALVLLGLAVTAQVGCGGFWGGWPDHYYDGYYGCCGPYGYPAYYPDDYLDCYDEYGPIYCGGPYYYDDWYDGSYGGYWYDGYGDYWSDGLWP